LWLAVSAALCAAGGNVRAQEPDSAGKLTVESLMQNGWQIAGYTGAEDGWSAFILFRHPSQQYLVQCRAGYDVLRQKRVTINCYELR
jgi:hypothetical protein